MMNKPNDWIAANMNAPEGSTLFDMQASGILPENTIIHEKDYYKDIPQVQNYFQKNGKFDENAFNDFYDSAVRKFDDYSNESFVENVITQMDRSPYDWTKLDNPNVIDTSVYISNIKDKNRTTMGTGNIWQIGDPVYSDREVAQANNVRDEFGKELDWTANDKGGLIKGLFMPSMALAEWEEDGIHIENGVEVEHKKGDLKLDWKGDPYMEKLGSKEGYGRDIVKWSDVLTKEDTLLNKFDPFDSDGLEKSIGGTIAKTALKIAPFFIPGVGPYLGYIAAGKELLSVMPTVLKAANGIIGDNDNMFGKNMNKWENWMEKYSGSMSDHGRQNFWNFENIGDVVASSFGQLASQRAIAEIPRKLIKNTTRASKTGQTLALSYMAMTSAKDSYSAFIEAGAEDWVAGLGMFGTMAMYYGLMNNDYFKEWIFRDSWLSDDVEFKQAFNKWINNYAKELGIEYKTMSPQMKKILGNKVVNTVYTKGSELWTKFAQSAIGRGLTTGVAHSGLNEGIEEVTEEVASDLIKGLAKGMEALGMKVTKDPTQKLDFGFSPEDFMQRYAASFVGGFVGGTVFKGYEYYENFQSGQKNISDIDDLDKQMAWYVRNGYAKKMQSILDDKLKKGELPADINKSFSKFAEVDSLDPNPDYTKRVYLPTTDKNQSHQKYLHDVLSSQIRLVETILNEHIVPYSDEELVTRIVNRIESEAAKLNMGSKDYAEKHLINMEIEMMKELGYLNLVARDANVLSAKIYKTGQDLKIAQSKLEKASGEEKAKATREVKQWEQLLKQYVEEYESIVDGERDAKYIASAYYRTSDELLSAYLDDGEFKATSDFFPETDIRHYTKLKYDLDFDKLEESVQNHLTGEFNMYLENKAANWEQRLAVMADLHYTLSERFAKVIQGLSDQYKGYKTDDSFTGSYEPGFWKKIKDISEHYNENPEQFKKETDFLSLYANKTVDKLSEQELNDLVDYVNIGSESPIDASDAETVQAALFNIQEQLHLVQNFETYLELSKVLGEGNVSVDQLMSKEGIEKWGEIFGMSSDTDASRRIQRQLIKDYYTKMKNEKILSSHESAMYKAHVSGILNVAIPSIEKMIEAFAIEDFPGMSLYDYSVDPEPYLSLMRTALGELKDAIILADSAKIDSSIERIKAIASNDGIFSEEDVEKNEWGEPLEDFDIEAYTNAILAPLQDVIKFAKEIEALKPEILNSPVIEFLNQLSLDINGKSLKILDLINDVENTLKLIDRIEDLELGSDTMNELYAAQNLLKIGAALLGSSYKDPRLGASLNDKINLFRKEDKLASIDNFLLGQELVRIANKVDTIIALVEQNVVGTVEEQKRIAANVFPKLIKSIVSPSVEDEDEKLFVKTLKDILGIEKNILHELWIKAGGISLDGISVDNYKEFEQTVRKWQKLVYDELAPKLTDKHGSDTDNVWEKIGQELGQKLGEGLGNMRSTQMSAQTDNISLYDSAIFFLTTISADPTEFWSKYKTVVDKENTKEQSFLPYFSQELAVQIGYARTRNNQLFNGFVSQLKKSGKTDDEYLKGISPLWNFMMIDGSAGSGKSTGFSYFLSEILKLDGYTVVASSQLADRAKNLGTVLETKHLTTDLILDKIIVPKNASDTKKTQKYVENKAGHVELSSEFEINKKIVEELKTIFGEDLSKAVLFIDEVTLLHAGKLRVLSEFAKETGLTLIALGDTKQESASFDSIIHSIEDFIFVKAPKLQASLRITNKAKKKNRLIIENILNDVDNKFSLYPNWSDTEMDGYLEEVLLAKSSELLTLSYTKNPSGLFGEMYSSNPESEIEFLLKTADKDNKIGIIVDDKSKDKYSKWAEDERVEIIHASKVQGGEYKYTVVDIVWNGDVKHTLLKKFNTLTSRSKVGTVIGYSEKNDIREIFSPGKQVFASKHDDTGHLSLQDPNSTENKAIREEYKQFRNDCLSDIVPFKPAEKPTEVGETPAGGESGGSGSGSGSGGSSGPGPRSITEGPKKSEIPVFDNKELVLEKSEEYQTRQRILKSESQNVVSEDDFFDLINDLNGTFIADLMNISKMLPEKADEKNEKNLKRWIQIVSGFILNAHVDPELEITESLRQLLIEFDPTKDGRLSSVLLKSLREKSGYYYFSPNGDKSVIHYCIDTENGTISIPIGQTTKKLSGAWKDINISLKQGVISVSSHGAIHTPIKEVLGDKFLYGSSRSMEFGIYAATSESNSDKDMVKGKAFLPLFLPHQHVSANRFFVPIKKNGKTWNTQDLDWKVSIRKPGVQRILSFDALFPAWVTLNDLSHHLADTGDEAKMKKYRDELGPIFSGTDFLRPKTNDNTARMPRSLVHSTRVGQLFTAVFRAFYSEKFDKSIREKFITNVLHWTEGSDKNAFEISIKGSNGHVATQRFYLNGNNIIIESINDSKSISKSIPLASAVNNIDVLLEALFPGETNVIESLATDLYRITPVYKNSSDKYIPAFDYTLFPSLIPNDKSVINKISEFLKEDAYFKHNVYLNIYSDSDFTSDDNVWKIVAPKIDDEYVWDIVYVGLPIYGMNAEQSNEILTEDNGKIVKPEIDSMWTPASVEGTEESHLEIGSGTSFVDKGNGWYQIQIGKTQGSVKANIGWTKEFLNESGPVEILEFSKSNVRIKTETGVVKTVNFDNFVRILAKNGVQEYVAVGNDQIKIGENIWTIKYGNSTRVNLEFGNSKMPAEIIGIDGQYAILLIQTSDGYLVERVKKPNLDVLQEVAMVKYIGKDDNYLYYTHNGKYFGKKLEYVFEPMYDFLTMDGINMDTLFIGDYQITDENIINALLADVDTVTYDKNATISKNNNVYNITGISMFGKVLNSFVENGNLPLKQIKLLKLDLNNNTIDVEINGKVETLSLKEGVTLDIFKFDSSKYKLSESLINQALRTKAITVLEALESIFTKHHMSVYDVFSKSIDQIADSIAINNNLEQILDVLNNEFEKSKYKFGTLYKIDISGNITETNDMSYTIGHILLQLNPELIFTEISDIKTISDSDTLKIHDFWVTLESEKKHYRLTSNGGLWNMEEINEEVVIAEEQRDNRSNAKIEQLKSEFEALINSSGVSEFVVAKLDTMKTLIDECTKLILKGDMISDDLYDQMSEIQVEFEESTNPSDVAIWEMFDSIIGDLEIMAIENEATNNTNCPI